jgi:hypothetical protein
VRWEGDLMIWAAIAAAVLGVALIGLGIHGRRIGDHPTCRRCGFDLSGAYPGRAVCPECGTNLAGLAAMRIGTRRRRRAVLAVGGTFFVGAAAVGGARAWGSATGFDWNTVKPAGWLRREVVLGDQTTAMAAAKELLARVQSGSADPAVASVVVEIVLAKQMAARRHFDILDRTQYLPGFDDPRPELDSWLMLFDAAAAGGAVTDEQAVRYIRQGINVGALVRGRVSAGSRMPVNCYAGDNIGITSRTYPVRERSRLVSCRIESRDGSSRELKVENTDDGGGRAAVDEQPGEYVLRLEFQVDVHRGALWNVPVGSYSHVQATPLRVEAAGTQVVALRTDEALAAAMVPKELTIVAEDDLDPKLVAICFEFDTVRAPVIASVWLEREGRRWPIGSVSHTWALDGKSFQQWISDMPTGLPLEEEFTLVFAPDLQRATETTTIDQVWAREIRVPGIRLRSRSGTGNP